MFSCPCHTLPHGGATQCEVSEAKASEQRLRTEEGMMEAQILELEPLQEKNILRTMGSGRTGRRPPHRKLIKLANMLGIQKNSFLRGGNYEYRKEDFRINSWFQ